MDLHVPHALDIAIINAKILMLVLDRTYEFTIGVTILYLTYSTCAQMDVHFH